ncbi:MAG: alpha/beta fold hydrolase [Pseudomonadota bacterium]
MSPDSYDIAQLSHDTLGTFDVPEKWRFVWAHGWGQNRHAMANLAQSLTSLGGHMLIDFPGFGDAPAPGDTWSTADYADFSARLLKTGPTAGNTTGPTVWLGHSFGGRVGIQIAARHPELIDKLVLIAAAGLQRQRSLVEQTRVQSKIYTFKTLKHLAPVLGLDVDKLRNRFGSTDYRNAGAMREILATVVREDLSDVAKDVTCPVLLIYGGKDTETPPEIGKRLADLIPNADLNVLETQDHYSLLGDGRHQVAKRIRDFLQS